MKRWEIERVGREIVDAAYQIHRELGPGLLESAYQRCMEYELGRRGLRVEREVPVPVIYSGLKIEVGYRLDLRVAGCVIIENKTVEKLLRIHEAQLLTYLKLTGARLGYLINWNVPKINQGIKRMVLGL